MDSALRYVRCFGLLSLIGFASSLGAQDPNSSDPNATDPSSSTTAPPAAVPDLPVKCVLVPDPYSNNLEQFYDASSLSSPLTNDYISKNFNPLQYVDSSGATQKTYVITTTRFADRVFLRAYCYVESSNTAPPSSTALINNTSFNVDSSISKPCTSSTLSGPLCVEVQSLKPSITLSGTSGPQLAGTLVLKNLSATGQAYSLDASKVKFLARNNATSTDIESTISTGNVEIQSLSGNASCRVVVSGANAAGGTQSLSCPASGSCNPTQVNSVQNGELIFKAVLEGVPGWETLPSSVEWNGGPDSTGLWKNPPVGTESVVTAKVTLGSGESARCAVRIRPDGVPFKVALKRAGDCTLFKDSKYYYLYDAQDKAPQTAALSKPLKYVGSKAEFGLKGGEMPFKGVLNGAANFLGTVTVGAGGQVSLPPVENRAVSRAVIVATPFKPNDPQGEFAKPAYYGLIDYSDYRQTTLVATGLYGEGQLQDDDLLVFQVFLAAVQRDPNNPKVDLRGKELPYFMFQDAIDNLPFDRIVPLMYDSCIPLFQVQNPVRADKPKLPSSLLNSNMCMFSRPQRFGDFKNGRVALNVLHLTPESANSQYPVEMMRASMQPQGCVASNPSDTVECWQVTSPIPAGSQQNPLQTHSACEYEETIMVPKNVTVTNGYGQVTGSYTVMVPQVVKKYTTGCTVLEKDQDNECGVNLAMRFAGYSMMQGAALGCAVKYDGRKDHAGKTLDLNGSPVTATLKDQGIIPYTSFGGSSPEKFDQYATKDGYGCIPCRFGANENLESSTGVIPVDQESANNPRKPIFSFAKASAPRECAKEISWEVRYFGSGACDGVNAPAGHFCNSSNISQQNCPSVSETFADRGSFTGGGNIAGAFKVKVCNGSSFEYDSVSVSWSPILIDVAGRGVEISRDHAQAVSFDIKGKGEKGLIDWPMNTSDVAFLVRPTQDQKVLSVKQLFGDNKKKNGFEALREYDSNRDGVVDTKDKRFKELALWFDRNRNGEVDKNELVAIKDSGVASVYLNYSKPSGKGIEGKTLLSVYFDSKEKRFKNVVDVYFYEYWKGGRRLASNKSR